jgi:hypothetical protein
MAEVVIAFKEEKHAELPVDINQEPNDDQQQAVVVAVEEVVTATSSPSVDVQRKPRKQPKRKAAAASLKRRGRALTTKADASEGIDPDEVDLVVVFINHEVYLHRFRLSKWWPQR